jgi:hypothetical protein
MTTVVHKSDSPAAPGALHYAGHVTYLYAYDIAYEMTREPIRELLGTPVQQFQIDSNKRAPRQPFFYRPQVANLPTLERPCPRGTAKIERQVKIFPLGAISISIRVPFEVASIADLVDYHDLKYTSGASLHEEATQLAEEIRKALAPYLIRPVDTLAPDEAYTVFCITSPLHGTGHQTSEGWLDAHRRQIAALLTEERDEKHLSDQEADESTSRYLSYYDHDLVVVDWDAALVVEDSRYVEEVIYLMELANLQLAELEWYDRLLDSVVDKSYRDLSTAAAAHRKLGKWSIPKTLKQLREIRIDLARLSDELSNITKFFGDWHLARIYQALAARFHLTDWHKTVDEKLKTLDNLYQLLQSDRNNRYMLILEVTIVLLFIIDLIMLFR